MSASDKGILAVEDAFCRILAARNPGTVWASSHRIGAGTMPRGHVVHLVVTDEADQATTSDGSVSASATRAA